MTSEPPVYLAGHIAGIIPSLCEHFTQDDWLHVRHHAGLPCPYWRAAAIILGNPDPMLYVAEWTVDLTVCLDAKGKVPLSLNDRGMHWAAKAKAISATKARTRNAVRDAGVPCLPFAHLELQYRPGTNRFRDVDNIVATQKPIVDALHHADDASLWTPILQGDDPRYVSQSMPVLLPYVKGEPAALWLIIRTADTSGVA